MKCWVVDFTSPDFPKDHFYFSGGHSTAPEWVGDIDKAIKFFSKEDSDAMINWRFNSSAAKSREIEWTK